MSAEDLEEQGLLLPEEKQGELEPATTVNRPALVLALLLGVTSVALIAVGSGRTLTWIGCVLYFVFLLLFLLVSNAGIARRAARSEELMAKRGGGESEGQS